jgi:hypothetical protein
MSVLPCRLGVVELGRQMFRVRNRKTMHDDRTLSPQLLLVSIPGCHHREARRVPIGSCDMRRLVVFAVFIRLGRHYACYAVVDY